MTSSRKRTGALWALIQTWMDSLHYPPSQNRLAERLGVSSSVLSEWKYGRGFPSPAIIRALAAELGLPYEVVLDAVLRDRGYRDPGDDEPTRKRGAS